jgi:hypothetical protein
MMTDHRGSVPPVRDDEDLVRARQLARWTDRRFLDPVLGFVLPGAGDVVGGAVGLWIVRLALKKRLPPIVVARMLLNLAVDSLVGLIPVAGDLFDVIHRANSKNLALLEARYGAPADRRASDWVVVLGAAAVFAAAVSIPIALLVLVIRAL